MDLNTTLNLREKIDYWHKFCVFFLIVTILLCLGQIVFSTFFQNSENFVNYFILRKGNISVVNIFFSNFVNKDLWEFYINLFIMWLGLVLFFIFFKKRTKRFFPTYIFIFFLISPLIISLINVELLQISTLNNMLGFSGIATVFLGFGVYSLSEFFYHTKLGNIDTSFKKYLKKIFTLVIPIIFLVIMFCLPGVIYNIINYGIFQGIILTIDRTKVNLIAHVIGFSFGFLTPVILNPVMGIFVSGE